MFLILALLSFLLALPNWSSLAASPDRVEPFNVKTMSKLRCMTST